MGFLDLIYPKKCLECGRGDTYLCKRCLSKVNFAWTRCPGCGKPTILGRTHIECLGKTPFNGVLAIWRYEGVVKKAILSLKYKFATDVAYELAKETVKKLEVLQVLPQKAIFVPIPLSSSRERWRGFNQSAEVGRLIATNMAWKYEPQRLIRVKASHAQATLPREKRQANIRGVFYAKKTKSSLPIILFDDVYTTGSTLTEAGKVLKEAGAREVWGFTLVH